MTGLNLKLKRTPGLYLIGFMGSGKTTIGRILADRIGWRFVDLDDEIEREQGRSIVQIFDHDGEEAFRNMEFEALKKRVRKVQMGNPMVVALGGGAFTQPHVIDMLDNNGIVIWIDTAFAVVKKRVENSSHRPLARDPIRFQALYYARREFYERAHYRVEVPEDSSAAAVEEILGLSLFD
jgi:shikimate kinase